MKAIKKKLLLAGITIGVMTPFSDGCVVYATDRDVEPPNSSNNTIEVNSTNYSINGKTTNINEGDTYRIVWGSKVIGVPVSGKVTGNKIIINGGTLKDVSGGYNYIDENGALINELIDANIGTTLNYVYVNGGLITNSLFGSAGVGTANSNYVYINDAIINNCYIHGGYSFGDANSNHIYINGGTINNSHIYGGMGGNDANIVNNDINISGNPNLTTTTLYGFWGGSNITHSGNALNISTKNITARNIYAFDNINFYLGSNIFNGDTILTLIDGATDLSNTAVKTVLQGGSTLTAGNSVTLLANNAGITTPKSTTAIVQEGISLTYPMAINLSDDGKNLIFKIGNDNNNPVNNNPVNNNPVNNNLVNNNLVNNQNSVPLIQNQDFTKYTNPETKILTVSQPISFVLPEIPNIPDNIVDTFPEFDLNADYTGNSLNDSNNNSNDNNDKDEIEISDSKDKSEEEKNKNVGSTDSPTHKGWEIFGDMGGGSLKHKTGGGGYIDTKMQNIDLGFARSLGNGLNKMTIAPIIDYQKTDFDSYIPDGVNADGSTRYVHGTGTTKYTGGGFILRNMNHNGFYYEGSLRVGKSKTDFASDNLDTTGFFGRVTYDSSATIVNGHIKIGKHLRVSPNSLIDIYGFYYHTHQGGSSANLSSGEHYDFSSANSGRLRIGYRWTTRTSKISKVYTGLAYQYERNTGVTGSYKDYKTPDTGSSGSSGMLEFGWLIKPLKNNPWAVDINATGWVGYQRGITAMAKISKAF